MRKWVLAICLLASFNAKAEIVTGEKCGDDCSWTLDTDTGQLTISGTGNMYDWDFFDTGHRLWDGGESHHQTLAPWGEYSADIQHIEVGNGITYIGDHSFYNTSATSVNLPNTLEQIGPQSFQYSNLQELTIPSSVTTLGFASLDHTKISHLELPDSITSIGDVAFRYMPLDNLVIPDSVISIEGDRVFLGVGGTIYCTASSPCADKGSENIVPYEREGGVYILNGKYYFTGADMAGETNECQKELGECKRDVLESKGICSGSACDTFIQSDGHYMLKYNGRTYQSINDLLKGNYDRRRIYTVEEASFVSGKKNTVRLRYK
ncbi:MAG: leucine-rich repeat domain-containing protein [Alphaproteobacteria bacterium]|nr:leucine-rich repeat domain-containing protein [Alphaproteobacteria bacterium]